MGGKFHLKLNIGSRPIANKYHEGKVKRTLKRELKVPEIAEREANGTSVSWSLRDALPISPLLLKFYLPLALISLPVLIPVPCLSAGLSHRA